MSAGRDRARVGEIRPSQILYAFGVGSIVDLPRFSVMMMGLDDWPVEYCTPVQEERLLRKVREEVGQSVQRLLSPPRTDPAAGRTFGAFDESKRVGVPVATFPRWYTCPRCHILAPLSSELFEFKPQHYRPDRTAYVHRNCPMGGTRAPEAIPARFLVACSRGHLDDFPWVSYVHGGATTCRARLKFSESGAGGEASQVWVRCETCDRSRSMAHAYDHEDGEQWAIPCTGRRPHLRDYVEECCEAAKPVQLGASNIWFPLSLSVLHIPHDTDELPLLVAEHWSALQIVQSLETLRVVRQVSALHPTASSVKLWSHSDEQILQAIERHRHGVEEQEEETEDLRIPEWRAFSTVDPSHNSRDFQLRGVSPPDTYGAQLQSVVLVERLREVNALVGFTRIDSPGDFGEHEEIPEERKAPLSRRDLTWVPATEVRGEGIFLRFSEAAIQRWMRNIDVIRRGSDLREAHIHWRRMRGMTDRAETFPGMRYVLLHSFSHALMRQLALECGYSAASITERLYVQEPRDEGGPMAGILLYTAAPDSEGTLGGLVRLGEPEELGRHIHEALELLAVCASDPLCAEHEPGDGSTSVHGAACHSCLFVPETSCERGNRYLDRATLVPTFATEGMAFFPAALPGS